MLNAVDQVGRRKRFWYSMMHSRHHQRASLTPLPSKFVPIRRDRIRCDGTSGVRSKGSQRNDFLDASEKVPTAPDLGLRHDQIYEARQFRDAEKAAPGVIPRTI